MSVKLLISTVVLCAAVGETSSSGVRSGARRSFSAQQGDEAGGAEADGAEAGDDEAGGDEIGNETGNETVNETGNETARTTTNRTLYSNTTTCENPGPNDEIVGLTDYFWTSTGVAGCKDDDKHRMVVCDDDMFIHLTFEDENCTNLSESVSMSMMAFKLTNGTACIDFPFIGTYRYTCAEGETIPEHIRAVAPYPTSTLDPKEGIMYESFEEAGCSEGEEDPVGFLYTIQGVGREHCIKVGPNRSMGYECDADKIYEITFGESSTCDPNTTIESATYVLTPYCIWADYEYSQEKCSENITMNPLIATQLSNIATQDECDPRNAQSKKEDCLYKAEPDVASVGDSGTGKDNETVSGTGAIPAGYKQVSIDVPIGGSITGTNFTDALSTQEGKETVWKAVEAVLQNDIFGSPSSTSSRQQDHDGHDHDHTEGTVVVTDVVPTGMDGLNYTATVTYKKLLATSVDTSNMTALTASLLADVQAASSGVASMDLSQVVTAVKDITGKDVFLKSSGPTIDESQVSVDVIASTSTGGSGTPTTATNSTPTTPTTASVPIVLNITSSAESHSMARLLCIVAMSMLWMFQ